MDKIYYFFRRPVKNNIRLSEVRMFPKDYFYGFTYLSSKYLLDVSDFAESNKLIHFIQSLINLLFQRFIKMNLSIIPVITQFPSFYKSNYLFCTVDSYGLACAFLKRLGLIKNTVIFNTIGLCDVLVDNPNLINLYKSLLVNVDIFISGASLTECEVMAKLLNFPRSKFVFVPFGIDTQYFSPMKVKEKNYSLIIGADSKRDWNLYRKLFRSFPNEKFIVITHPNLFKQQPLSNVKVIYNLPIGEVRDYIAEAKTVIILSKQNYHFAGQSTSFRAMSMAKSVIFTKSYGVEEYGFKNNQECIMVSPGDWINLKKSFLKLNNNRQIREKMGLEARAKIIKYLSLKLYTNKLAKVLNTL